LIGDIVQLVFGKKPFEKLSHRFVASQAICKQQFYGRKFFAPENTDDRLKTACRGVRNTKTCRISRVILIRNY